MRRQSLKHNLCICCNTNRGPDEKQLLCKECYKFIHDKLQLTPQYMSKKLGMKVYDCLKHKCSFCDSKAVITYNDYDTHTKYYICKYHRDRWLTIGCQLGQLAKFLTVE
jgi:hypothetical protein